MKLALNNIDPSVFRVNRTETVDGTQERADIVAAGRMLAYEYARKGANGVHKLMGLNEDAGAALFDDQKYKETNSLFQASHLLYCAKLADAAVGKTAPKSMEEFRRRGPAYYKNSMFFQALQGIYEEILIPILPRVISEAVGVFAETVEVGFGETYAITVGSNDIVVFQDSAPGASRSVPRNRFYDRTVTLNPQWKTAQINAKWAQLAGNNTDFGRFFANIAAGMYAKIMGMWNQAMATAMADPTLVPSSLKYNFSSQNWVSLANKLSAVDNVPLGNLFATGSMVALSKVLPSDVTGSTNVNMDAAIATLLGADYTRSGYLGQYMAVRLMPLTDVVIPGTQNTTVQTMLDPNTIYMMAGAGRKPLAIAMNEEMPIQLTVDPSKAGDMELAFNLSTALDVAAIFSNHVGQITI